MHTACLREDQRARAATRRQVPRLRNSSPKLSSYSSFTSSDRCSCCASYKYGLRITLVPAQIIDELSSSDVTVVEGETLRLVCNVTGVPYPEVRWLRRSMLTTSTAAESSSLLTDAELATETMTTPSCDLSSSNKSTSTATAGRTKSIDLLSLTEGRPTLMYKTTNQQTIICFSSEGTLICRSTNQQTILSFYTEVTLI